MKNKIQGIVARLDADVLSRGLESILLEPAPVRSLLESHRHRRLPGLRIVHEQSRAGRVREDRRRPGGRRPGGRTRQLQRRERSQSQRDPSHGVVSVARRIEASTSFSSASPIASLAGVLQGAVVGALIRSRDVRRTCRARPRPRPRPRSRSVWTTPSTASVASRSTVALVDRKVIWPGLTSVLLIAMSRASRGRGGFEGGKRSRYGDSVERVVERVERVRLQSVAEVHAVLHDVDPARLDVAPRGSGTCSAMGSRTFEP